MKTPFSFLIVLLSCSFILVSCKKDKDRIELPHMYAGALQIEYTKGFPSFSVKAVTGVIISKNGMVTFDNNGKSNNFDAEDIYYEDGEPVSRFRMTGTLKFISAAGEVKEINEKYNVLVKVNTIVNGTVTICGWDDDLG
jgi:hypothetical protein